MPDTTTQTQARDKTETREAARRPRPGRDQQSRDDERSMTPTEPRGEVQVYREFDRALTDMERRMNRIVGNLLGQERDLWNYPLFGGLALQPGIDGRLRFQPFGYLQETFDLAGVREPLLTWRTTDDDKSIEFRAEVPGVKKSDISVEVQADGLVIEGKSPNALYSVRCNPSYTLQPDSGEAHYEDGVLTVKCRIAESTTPKGKKLTIR